MFARSTKQLLDALDEFQSLEVDVISYAEGVDTTTPQGRLMFILVAGLNQFERDLTAENVRAGMARSKAQGKHTGRPALAPRSGHPGAPFTSGRFTHGAARRFPYQGDDARRRAVCNDESPLESAHPEEQ